MTRSKTEQWMRLGVGVALNVVLWPLVQAAGVWSSYEREYRLALVSGGLAAAAIVSVVPLFWRGQPWHAAIAFVLLWLPVLALFGVAVVIFGRG
jgi:site-specific recombinase